MKPEKLFMSKIQKIREDFDGGCADKLQEFKGNSGLSDEERFNELCFCILVAGSNLEQTKKAWQENKNNFQTLGYKELRKKLKESGCRFNHRASYIVEARETIKNINFNEKDHFTLREQLVKNIKGLGMKEASHFLRNLGYENFAILDTHVLKTLKENGMIKEIPKTLTKNKYLEIEKVLEKLAGKLNISQAELDLYLFYFDSKKIPKK
ncbi:MAG: N-glycosylase/DNA lyase [Candidatus Pacearchaeota archaeon]|nr:N-glycosylase/DNA lyase [Candidatus Pacearchaeota archaeon]